MTAGRHGAPTIRQQLAAAIGPEIVALALIIVLVLVLVLLFLGRPDASSDDHRATGPSVTPTATEPR